MIDAVAPLTAKAKLAMSRAELLAGMGYEEMRSEAGAPPGLAAAPGRPAQPPRSAFGRWWRQHPMHGAFELGQPFLESFARKHPMKLVAYSAGTGAMLWILRPWKLLSAATLATLLVKGSNLSSLFSTPVEPEATRTAGDPVTPP